MQRAARRLQSLTNFTDLSCVLPTYIPNLSWAHIFSPQIIFQLCVVDATPLSSLKLCIPFRVHLFGSFYRPKWRIFLPFHILQLVKSPPFHLPEAWKFYRFWKDPPDPCIGHYGTKPPPSRKSWPSLVSWAGPLYKAGTTTGGPHNVCVTDCYFIALSSAEAPVGYPHKNSNNRKK